jgi:5'-3' exonuclease
MVCQSQQGNPAKGTRSSPRSQLASDGRWHISYLQPKDQSLLADFYGIKLDNTVVPRYDPFIISGGLVDLRCGLSSVFVILASVEGRPVKIHLVDGTYELFRSFYGPPSKKAPDGREVGATIGLLRSLLHLLSESGATHIGCAFDHVVESFRNDLFPGYKTGEGIDPDLYAQFPLAEQAVAALGLVVWPMVEFEADDAIATAAARFRDVEAVDQVVICSPDKDLTQLVFGSRVVCWDRRRDIVYDEEAVVDKFGVSPASIPDWLALVGDAADGIPGVPTWGAKSASALLSQFQHIEAIPEDMDQWGLSAGRARRLAENLAAHKELAFLYRRLTTLRTDVPLAESEEDLEWRGARPGFRQLCHELGADALPDRIPRWASGD